jgi:hypothetical protein
MAIWIISAASVMEMRLMPETVSLLRFINVMWKRKAKSAQPVMI